MTGSDLRVGGILLAAGGSSRLGMPKQLVEFEGEPLIRRAAKALINAGCYPVVTVLGADTVSCRDAVADLEVETAENPDWTSGMGSSIGAGLRHLLSSDALPDAVLVTLCDQPLITAGKLRAFIERFGLGRPPVVAARYNGVLGVPALFSMELFGELMGLKGDKGARELIRNGTDAAAIDLPEAAVDIDTVEDLKKAGASPPS